MFEFLYIAFDLLWTATFILVIRRGFKDKTFGMPFAAAVVNLVWDLAISFIYPAPAPQLYFEMLFAVFDAIILLQVLRYWRSEFPNVSPARFYSSVVLAFLTAGALIWASRIEWNDPATVYSGNLGNLMGSILFVWMLLQRGDLRGQSFYIALFKWLGTGAASLAFVLFKLPGYPRYDSSVLLPVLGAAMFAYDFVYVVLVYQMCRKQGINPWTRV